MDETRKPTLIASVQRALHLMEAVASHPNGAPAKQLAREARLPLATTYHLLRTLAHEGYASRLPSGVWVLGDRLQTLQGRSSTQRLLSRIRPALVALRDELGAAAYFGLHEDGEIRIIDIADGPRTPRVDLWVGFEEAAHATAIGKCVLRQLDDDRRLEYLSRHPLVDLTPNTITEPRELLRALRTPGELALDREEYALGTGCAAVPVTDATGSVVGALAVSCRPSRLPKIEAAASRLRATAARLQRAITLTLSAG
ncbi:DNA-binding transcriptional regulator, IclR family [Thermomonospora echinospora]|uniref:DNA-binding transcriptional regulator, IclR family n=1 Tax=Thermomonospora echinospora TaxID=1992 RepID=A0A1H6E3T2_9ACTN|nr:IclR family transcriptional regulator [Thermomonospora echinospora]SEG92292.1 DNA-binding transcriptional regulator, IclR family [Thermomonospora echinospora]